MDETPRPELLGTQLFDLTGRTALVTGAGRGLGKTMALALAAAGADVAVSSRTAPEIEAVAEEIRHLKGAAARSTADGVQLRPMARRALALTADVTVEADCDALVARTIGEFGHLDILVNNAGINIRKQAVDLAGDDLRRVMATNFEAYFYCARAAGRHMLPRRSGKVINISSIMGQVTLDGQTAYSSSKGAVDQLTRTLAIEWAAHNVQVNGIGPTYFETELTRPLRENAARNAFLTERMPMKRWGQPHELAGAVIFLASAASNYVTGHTLMVDGGWTAW